MKQLFKQSGNKLLYWQAWYARPNAVVVNEGQFGKVGTKTRIKIVLQSSRLEDTLNREYQLKLATRGYHQREYSGAVKIVFEPELPSAYDADHLHQLVLDTLRDTGNSYEIEDAIALESRTEILCPVFDLQMAQRVLVKMLKDDSILFSKTKIYSRTSEDSQFSCVWDNGEFSATDDFSPRP
ncbi:MAG: hypothetical protein WCT03_14620 [Candidatus Obscuribacterales bacterium]|jgi:hypothetical protein